MSFSSLGGNLKLKVFPPHPINPVKKGETSTFLFPPLQLVFLSIRLYYYNPANIELKPIWK